MMIQSIKDMLRLSECGHITNKRKILYLEEMRYGLRKRMRSPVRLSCIRWRPSLRERVRTSARGICKDALVRFRLSEVTAYGRNEKGIRPQ